MKKLLLLLPLSLILLTACSKEKRFERMLFKHDGEWDILSIDYTLITTDEYNQKDTVIATAENPGIFKFEKEGHGAYNFGISGTVHFEGFSWNVVNETAIALTHTNESYDIFTGYTETLVVAFTGEKTDKDKMTLTGTETIQNETDNGTTESVLNATIDLEKK